MSRMPKPHQCKAQCALSIVRRRVSVVLSERKPPTLDWFPPRRRQLHERIPLQVRRWYALAFSATSLSRGTPHPRLAELLARRRIKLAVGRRGSGGGGEMRCPEESSPSAADVRRRLFCGSGSSFNNQHLEGAMKPKTKTKQNSTRGKKRSLIPTSTFRATLGLLGYNNNNILQFFAHASVIKHETRRSIQEASTKKGIGVNGKFNSITYRCLIER